MKCATVHALIAADDGQDADADLFAKSELVTTGRICLSLYVLTQAMCLECS